MPVHGSPAPDRLEDRQYVVLLLCLLINRDGHIVHGDAGAPETDGPTEEVWVHFHGPGGLLGAVQQWLAARPGAITTAADVDV